MKENFYPHLEKLAVKSASGAVNEPVRPPEDQSFKAYRLSRPARQTARRQAIYLARVGGLTEVQERIVAATAEYLAIFFNLPVRRGADFDPATFQSWASRFHPTRGHEQLLTDYIINEMLWLDRPEEALICLAVTNWDLCSNDHPGGKWGSVFGEAMTGHAGVWSLRYLGDAGGGANAFRRCLKRSCAVAAHEALHVLGLDHCAGPPCNMKGSACLSGPLHLCPPCLRKLCWNRQVDLIPYLQSLGDWLERWQLAAEAEQYQSMMQLLGGDECGRGSN